MTFHLNEKPVDICQTIQLTNVSESNLAYKVFKLIMKYYLRYINVSYMKNKKIKITSPDKFRVKPGTGVIEKSSSVQIMINYLKEFHNSNANSRDKFLILWTPITEKLSSNELNEFWKNAIQQKNNVFEHKYVFIV